MSSIINKSIVIEGDKSIFVSKAAIDRLKKDLREESSEKLLVNAYFKEGWTYSIITNTDIEMKIKLVNKIQEPIKPHILECDEKRKLLKEKIKMMRINKLSSSQMKYSLRNKVPADILDIYLQIKKSNIQNQIPAPDVVLSKPDEFKNIIYTMIQSFSMYKGKNNLIVNYYRLLAKHLNISTTVVPTLINEPTNEPTNNFIEMLRKQRNDNDNDEDEIDDEMNEIYESLGISMDKKNKIKEIDESVSEIYREKTTNDLIGEKTL